MKFLNSSLLLLWMILAVLFTTAAAPNVNTNTALAATQPTPTVSPSGDPIKILFLGNSFVECNGLPSMLQKIAQAAGKNVFVSAYLVGGQDLYRFWIDPNKTALNKINAGPGAGDVWDYIVLEPWQKYTSGSPAQDMYDYGRLFVDEIAKITPRPKTLIYMVHWTPQPSLTTMNSEQSLFTAIVNSKPSTILVPVEWAWRQGLIEHPEQSWTDPADGVHPGPRRTYLAAVSMYATIFRESPVGLANIITSTGYMSCGSITNFTTEDASYLQNLVLWSLNNYQVGISQSTPIPTPSGAPSGAPKPGDANGDGLINRADLIIWIGNYAKLLTGVNVGDFNNNGKVNILDFGIWFGNFGK